jgi:hypothetical protein
MFGLTQEKDKSVVVPVYTAMTNGDMAKAIREEIKLNKELFADWNTEHKEQVKTFLNTLKISPRELFVDPCYDEFCELIFYFGFHD